MLVPLVCVVCVCVFVLSSSSLRKKRAIESRFQKPKQTTPVPEVHQDYSAVPELHQGYGTDEAGPKCIEECLEAWNTVPLPSPSPAFDTMGMGEPLDVWPPHRVSFSSTESDREERDFAAAAEFSQALCAIMPSSVMTPEDRMAPTVMAPTVMTPADITAAVMAPDNLTSANPTSANSNPARYGCRTRPTAFVFDARTEKAISAAPTTIPTSSVKPPLSYDSNGSFDGSDGGVRGGPLAPLGTPPRMELPFDGLFLEKQADSGDIKGGNAMDSVAEVADNYLLAGSDEENYEDTVAADTFLETTLAMLPPQQQTALQQQEAFVFGSDL